jgi:RNA polymerase sigma-70 factor (ECF subfamily)
LKDPDRDLVEQCQRGRGPAFEEAYRELYALYKDRVFTICLRVTGNEEDALDAAQETMVTLARRIQDFAFRSRFSSWVYRIAVNAAIDIRRRRLEAPHGSVTTILGGIEGDGSLEFSPAPASSDPADQVAGGESREAVRQALSRINPKFSSILTLRYILGLSYEEIAESEGCNLGTVKSRLNRAHAAIREHLVRQGGPDLAGP